MSHIFKTLAENANSNSSHHARRALSSMPFPIMITSPSLHPFSIVVFYSLLTVSATQSHALSNQDIHFTHLRGHQPLLKALANRPVDTNSFNFQTPQGYTFDPCLNHEDCIHPRACYMGDWSGACNGSQYCICVLEFNQICSNCEQCEMYPNESCLRIPTENEHASGLCASAYTVYEGILVEIGCDTYPTADPFLFPDSHNSSTEEARPSATEDGTWPISTEDAPAQSSPTERRPSGPRPFSPPPTANLSTITTTSTPSSKPQPSSRPPSQPSTAAAEQAPRPTEKSIPQTRTITPTPSRSPKASPPHVQSSVTPSPQASSPISETQGPPFQNNASDASPTSPSTNVCIDARALQHLPRWKLVYMRHRNAFVLCDAFDSCATPGHMVLYHDRAMMMREYCGQYADCYHRVLLVNSPRFENRLRIASGTHGLLFTAFAARFESRFEQHALRLAIRMGF